MVEESLFPPGEIKARQTAKRDRPASVIVSSTLICHKTRGDLHISPFHTVNLVFLQR